MLLGDVLAQFDDEAAATETIVALDDLPLVARVMKEAESQGRSLGEFAASTLRYYSARASDEEWITLMGALGRARDPGAVCMKRAFAFVLQETTSTTGKPCHESNNAELRG